MRKEVGAGGRFDTFLDSGGSAVKPRIQEMSFLK